MPEAGHGEVRREEPVVPRQGQRADTPAEAFTEVSEPAPDRRDQLEQGGCRAPEIRDAPAVDVPVPRIDAVQHVAGGVVRDAADTAALV
jgi:hypothetical protein